MLDRMQRNVASMEILICSCDLLLQTHKVSLLGDFTALDMEVRNPLIPVLIQDLLSFYFTGPQRHYISSCRKKTVLIAVLTSIPDVSKIWELQWQCAAHSMFIIYLFSYSCKNAREKKRLPNCESVVWVDLTPCIERAPSHFKKWYFSGLP